MTTDSFRLKWLDRNRKIGPRVEAIISNPKAFSDGHKRHLLKYCMHFMLLRLLHLLLVFTVLIAPLRVLGPAAVAVQLLEPTAGSQSCRPPVSRAKGLGSRNQ